MNEQDYLWLLARLYLVQRRNYITSHHADIHEELINVLDNTERLPGSIESTPDSDILEAFKPGEAEPPKLTKPKKTKGA